MDKLIYFFQFLVIIFLFTLFKLIGFKYSSIFSGCLATLIGPVFRSKSVIDQNINRALPKFTAKEKNKLIKKMWTNYGKILSDYVFLKNFRTDQTFKDKIKIINAEILEEIKEDGRPVIFVSGHFNNFELMAMSIEKSGINLAAVYRPLNNPFLNPLMEKIRKKYLCKNQIKKGIAGTKELLKHFKKNNSIALMIDQRVSEGIKSDFFGKKASTTTIPAQFAKKFNTKIVPVYIERLKNDHFKIEFYQPILFSNKDTINQITLKLNGILETMILKNPEQWIWTHNRWK